MNVPNNISRVEGGGNSFYLHKIIVNLQISEVLAPLFGLPLVPGEDTKKYLSSGFLWPLLCAVRSRL